MTNSNKKKANNCVVININGWSKSEHKFYRRKLCPCHDLAADDETLEKKNYNLTKNTNYASAKYLRNILEQMYSL